MKQSLMEFIYWVLYGLGALFVAFLISLFFKSKQHLIQFAILLLEVGVLFTFFGKAYRETVLPELAAGQRMGQISLWLWLLVPVVSWHLKEKKRKDKGLSTENEDGKSTSST